MTDTTPPTEKRVVPTSGAGLIGVIMFIVCVIAGVFAGRSLKAAELDTGSFAEYHDLLTITNGDGTFNWLLFLMCAGFGMVCLCIGLVVSAATNAIRSEMNP